MAAKKKKQNPSVQGGKRFTIDR